MNKSPLLDFIKEKVHSSQEINSVTVPSVITISREYGCPGILVSTELSKELSKIQSKEWSVVDKQIISQAAEELDIPPGLIEKISKHKPAGIFEELFLSFSDTHLPSDIKVKKTIARILRTVALHGNVIILGRGGVVLSRDIKKSLHIHLHAPVSWRVGRVKVLENITSDNEAIGRIKTVDSERVFLKNYFAGETIDNNIFDVSFNCKYITADEIVHSIVELAKLKGILS
jgi:cytidylate kinase